jgi:hypothetical protein
MNLEYRLSRMAPNHSYNIQFAIHSLIIRPHWSAVNARLESRENTDERKMNKNMFEKVQLTASKQL